MRVRDFQLRLKAAEMIESSKQLVGSSYCQQSLVKHPIDQLADIFEGQSLSVSHRQRNSGHNFVDRWSRKFM